MPPIEDMLRGLRPERFRTAEPARADGQASRVSMPFSVVAALPGATLRSIGRQRRVFGLNPAR